MSDERREGERERYGADEEDEAARVAVQLAPAEAAVLELTSDLDQLVSTSEPMPGLRYATSKDSYLWAGAAAALGVYTVELGETLSNVNILSALYQIVSHSLDDLRSLYSDPPRLLRGPTPFFAVEAGPGRVLSPPMHIRGDQQRAFCRIAFDLAEKLLGEERLDGFGETVNDAVQSGYSGLVERNLISDPILETGLAFAILSFMPFSVTRRTKKGRQVYLKLQSMLWRYEREHRRDGSAEVNVTFEAARIARVLKTGVVAAVHEATKIAGKES